MEQSYKEKYEQALARANELYNRGYTSITGEIFPELADSEDEKIRKALKQYFVNSFQNNGVAAICGVHVKDVLDWLEKQGQVKESTISQHENRTCEENGNSLTYEDERVRKEIINYFRCQSEEEPTRKEIHDKWIAWLENIPYTIDHEKREGFHLGYKAGLEKQGEQKPADKVEPKFKDGEKELTNEESCEGLIRGMINEHNRVTKEVLRTEYEKGRADVLAKIDAIDVDEMVCDSGATSRVTQYWYVHGVNDVIKKLKEGKI